MTPIKRRIAVALTAPMLVTLGLAAGAATAQAATTCTSTALFGVCSYLPETVNQNVWDATTGSAQTLTATSASSWHVSAFEPTGAFVRAYPNVHEFLGEPISDYNTVLATFADTMPTGGSEEAAFDIWINGAPGTSSTANEIEVMIWTNDHGQTPSGKLTTTATINGQTFKVWECPAASCGHPYYAFVLTTNESSGKVHIVDTLGWLTSNRLVPASDPLTQVADGWEIGNTGGTTETFSMTKYSLDTKLNG